MKTTKIQQHRRAEFDDGWDKISGKLRLPSLEIDCVTFEHFGSKQCCQGICWNIWNGTLYFLDLTIQGNPCVREGQKPLHSVRSGCFQHHLD